MDELAGYLFDAFCKTLPLNGAALRDYKRKPEKVRNALVKQGLDSFFATARVERERRKLGVIGRARVAYALQKRMLAAGYPPQLTKQVLLAMLMAAFTKVRV